MDLYAKVRENTECLPFVSLYKHFTWTVVWAPHRSPMSYEYTLHLICRWGNRLREVKQSTHCHQLVGGMGGV